jgi:hypothetical protein
VVYGASKQGKTSLVSKHLPYTDNVVAESNPKTAITDIYRSVLRQANIKLHTATTETNGRELGASIGIKFKASIPLFGGAIAESRGEVKTKNDLKQETEEIEFNLELPQDICELLEKAKFSKRVILENFHYLDDEKQK